jgi:hypothetical protein
MASQGGVEIPSTTGTNVEGISLADSATSPGSSSPLPLRTGAHSRSSFVVNKMSNFRDLFYEDANTMGMNHCTNKFKDERKEEVFQQHCYDKTRPMSLVICTICFVGAIVYNIVRFFMKYNTGRPHLNFTVRLSLLLVSSLFLLPPYFGHKKWKASLSAFITILLSGYVLDPYFKAVMSWEKTDEDVGLYLGNSSAFQWQNTDYVSSQFIKSKAMDASNSAEFLQNVLWYLTSRVTPLVNQFPVYAVIASVVVGVGFPLSAAAGIIIDAAAIATVVLTESHKNFACLELNSFIGGQMLFLLSLGISQKFDQSNRITTLTLMKEKTTSKKLRKLFKSMTEKTLGKGGRRHFSIQVQSPIELAISKLTTISNNSNDTAEKAIFHEIIDFLVGTDVLSFRPNLQKEVNRLSDLKMDKDVKEWLLGLDPENSRVRQGSVEEKQKKKPGPLNTEAQPRPQLLKDLLLQKVVNIIGDLSDWNLNMFKINKLTNGSPLVTISWCIFKKHNLLSAMKINPNTFVKYMGRIESAYESHPYHSNIHGADVLHGLHYMMNTLGFMSSLSTLDLFTALFSAAVHDVGHLGVSNRFLIASNHPLALRYNDSSVLERMHIAVAFQTGWSHPDSNIFSQLDDDQYTKFRQLAIEMVLATDLKSHFAFGARLKTFQRQEEHRLRDEPLVFMQTMLKLADIGHSSKERTLHLQWTAAIIEEFFLQGDREKDLGMSVSPFMDRNVPDTKKNQIGFFDYIVLPFWETATSHLEELQPLYEVVLSNFDYWNNLKAKI